ncbi:MAG: glycosyltransferase family 2 protein [Hydrogenophaga sp.]|uniref:glycosyltransferase family 2 protein n=1 Tax=Hydrogenophaga sp. TaxID=1904254 RepID=UPI003D1444EF
MSKPRVSIGMPIYNGALTIAETMESLLAQSFTDFEIIVSDNASTDHGVEIVKAFQQRDARIRLIQQPVNLGANGNFSAVVDAAEGEYFKWSTCSDLCSSSFLQASVDLLDRHPEVVLAAPKTQLFTSDSKEVTPYTQDIEIRDTTPAARFKRLVETLKLNNAMNGLIRTQALRYKRPAIDHYLKADIVMVSCLALQGQFRIAPEAIFLRRMDPATSTSLMSPEDDIKHHYPVMSSRALFPTWRLYRGWWRAVQQAPVPLEDRRFAHRYLLRMCNWERKEFLHDLAGGLGYFARLRWMGGRA